VTVTCQSAEETARTIVERVGPEVVPYGLAAGVWAGDKEKATAVARRTRAGQCAINGGDANHEAPFGGYKESGNGREFGVEGLHE
jgi:aldehyde dehydrogenase (NAD+)